jgi:hypothetical protein
VSQFERDVIELGPRAAFWLWNSNPEQIPAAEMAQVLLDDVNERYPDG